MEDIWKIIHDSEDYNDPQFHGIDPHKLYQNIGKALKSQKESIMKMIESKRKEVCPDCGGDGKETCNNPDHGGYEAELFGPDNGRIGCPVCGHDPKHKVPNGGDCESCGGTGKTSNDNLIDDIKREIEEL
jgi:hypothetical protein